MNRADFPLEVNDRVVDTDTSQTLEFEDLPTDGPLFSDPDEPPESQFRWVQFSWEAFESAFGDTLVRA